MAIAGHTMGVRAPSWLVAHWRTWRPYTTCYPAMLALAAAALSDQHAQPTRVVGVCAGITLCWIGAHYAGDYLDRSLDASAKPHRPIPSGVLSPRAALACAGSCFAAFLGLQAALDPATVPIAALLMAGAVTYSAVFKQRGLWGNAIRGMLGGLAVTLAALTCGDITPTIAAVAIAIALHDTSSNLVGTVRDVEGDRQGGYATFAVRHGTPAAVAASAALYATAIAIAIAALPGSPVVWALMAGAVAIGAPVFAQLVRRSRALSPRAALRAHDALCGERLVLAGAFVACGLGALAGLLATAAAVVVSLQLSRAMRARHEFGAPVIVSVGGPGCRRQ